MVPVLASAQVKEAATGATSADSNRRADLAAMAVACLRAPELTELAVEPPTAALVSV